MNLYVYCLIEKSAPVRFEGVSGIGGSMVQVISRGSISALASQSDGESVVVTRENVIAHQEVVNRALAETTPLPFRFGALVSLEGLQSYVDRHRSELEALFARVRGAVEMNTKVLWDKEAVRDKSVISATQSVEALSPGRAFLVARQREIAGDEILRREAEETASWLKACLNDLARETHLTVRPAESLVIKAAHLVERSRVDLYRERVKSIRKQRSDLRFMTSGPWPPYSFADIRA